MSKPPEKDIRHLMGCGMMARLDQLDLKGQDDPLHIWVLSFLTRKWNILKLFLINNLPC